MHALLAIPTPLDARRYFAWVSRGLDRDALMRYIGDVHHMYRVQECYAAASDVASSLSCPVVNLRRAFLEKMHLAPLLCADGIHPSAEGHRVMLGCLLGRFGAQGDFHRLRENRANQSGKDMMARALNKTGLRQLRGVAWGPPGLLHCAICPTVLSFL